MNKREAARLLDEALNILDVVHCLHTGGANEISFDTWQDMFARGKDYEAARKQWQRLKRVLERHGVIEHVEDGREDHVVVKPGTLATAAALEAEARAVLDEGKVVERERFPDRVTIRGRTYNLKVYGRLIPPLTEREYVELRASIAELGVIDHVFMDRRGNIVDGRHRLIACHELGIEDFPVEVLEIDDPDRLEHIANVLNLERRHLSKQKKAEVRRAIQAYVQAQAMRVERKSLRAIADEEGVGRTTIHEYAEAAPRDPRARVRGKDGRLQPAVKPSKEEQAKRRQEVADLLAQEKDIAEIVKATGLKRRTVERIVEKLQAEPPEDAAPATPPVKIVARTLSVSSANWRDIDREADPVDACLEAALYCIDELRDRLQDPELAKLATAAHDIVDSVVWRLLEAAKANAHCPVQDSAHS